MDFKLATPFLEAFEELNKLSEGARTAEDPYGYGPYKVPTDPKLKVGDYIKAKRYSSDTEWYPAQVTRITPDFVDYTISGFGFIKNGTAVRSASAKQTFSNLRKRLLGEAANDPAKIAASKKFWSSAKIGKMEEDAFHTAFDDELKDLGVMDLFDANGVLTNDHPRISKTIDDNPNSYAARALGKLWGLRYSKNGPHQLFKSEIDAQKKAAEEEKARKAEEEKKLEAEKLRKYQDLLLDYLRKADPVVVDTYEEVTGIPVLDSASLEKHHLAINPKTGQYERWYGLFFEGGTSIYKISEEMFQDEPLMLKTIKAGLEKAVASTRVKEAEEELNKIDVIKNRVPGAVVTMLGESGTEYEINISAQRVLYMSIDGESVNSVQMIDEPYEVICVKVYQNNGNHSTRRDSESTVYYSWNSKYETILGTSIPKKFDRVDGFMGSYTETVKIDKPSGNYYSQVDGIDSWARYYNYQVATD